VVGKLTLGVEDRNYHSFLPSTVDIRAIITIEMNERRAYGGSLRGSVASDDQEYPMEFQLTSPFSPEILHRIS
jgi:hypothetical protein